MMRFSYPGRQISTLESTRSWSWGGNGAKKLRINSKAVAVRFEIGPIQYTNLVSLSSSIQPKMSYWVPSYIILELRGFTIMSELMQYADWAFVYTNFDQRVGWSALRLRKEA
jgi:hypothetical protein